MKILLIMITLFSIQSLAFTSVESHSKYLSSTTITFTDMPLQKQKTFDEYKIPYKTFGNITTVDFYQEIIKMDFEREKQQKFYLLTSFLIAWILSALYYSQTKNSSQDK